MNAKSNLLGYKELPFEILNQINSVVSAVKQTDAINWKTPGNCVFHCSDFWTAKYLERFRNPDLEVYVADHEFPDADVTSYIKLLKQCGIVLYGRKIEEVFADVSDEDFWLAISADIDEYNFHAYDARYLASNVLIAKEAASAVRDWAFNNTPFNQIFSYMKYTNEPSAKSAVSWGCHQVDEFEDEVNEITKVFAITRDEWKNSDEPINY